IPVYWIINLAKGRVEVYTDPSPAGYQSRGDFQPGQQVPVAIGSQPLRPIAVVAIHTATGFFPPVLYLRSFGDDGAGEVVMPTTHQLPASFEQRLVAFLSRIGPVVAMDPRIFVDSQSVPVSPAAPCPSTKGRSRRSLQRRRSTWLASARRCALSIRTTYPNGKGQKLRFAATRP